MQSMAGPQPSATRSCPPCPSQALGNLDRRSCKALKKQKKLPENARFQQPLYFLSGMRFGTDPQYTNHSERGKGLLKAEYEQLAQVSSTCPDGILSETTVSSTYLNAMT